MKRISLGKEISEIVNQESIENKKVNNYSWGKITVKTVSSGTFKCTFPTGNEKEILARAKRLARKPVIKDKIPETQKILSFLSACKEIIPLYMEMVKKGHTSLWFRRRVWESFPENVDTILNKAAFGCSQNDREYAIATMPRAWEPYKTVAKKNTAVKQAS